MNALQKLLGRDDKFYLLLDSSAAQAEAGARALGQLLTALDQSTATLQGEIDQSRRKHKRIGQEITEQLFQTFSTPLEREDIEGLSNAFYKISKNIEKIAQRLEIRPPGLGAEPVRRQIALLEQGTAILVKMTAALRTKNHAETIRDGYERIQAIEGDADRIMNEQLRELYQGTAEARAVVFWKDMYELVEKGIDRCRDAGAAMFHIVLKNS